MPKIIIQCSSLVLRYLAMFSIVPCYTVPPLSHTSRVTHIYLVIKSIRGFAVTIAPPEGTSCWFNTVIVAVITDSSQFRSGWRITVSMINCGCCGCIRCSQPMWLIFSCIPPEAIVVYYSGFGPRSQLDPINQVIDVLCHCIWSLPGPTQLRWNSLLPLGVVEPYCITSLKYAALCPRIIVVLHSITRQLQMSTCKGLHLIHSVLKSGCISTWGWSTLPLAEETIGPQVLSDPGPALALPEYSQLFHALQSNMPPTITVCDDPNHADDLPQTWKVVIQWFD